MKRILILMLLFTAHGLPTQAQPLRFRLEQKADTMFDLQLLRGTKVLDVWQIPHPVLSLSQGDITGDGVPEAAVCVVKRTPHFEKVARRPWIFKIVKGRYIRPLWLGSQLSHPLDSFAIARGHVVAIEHEADGTWLVSRYRQQGFGLQHDAYLGRHLTRSKALRIWRTNK